MALNSSAEGIYPFLAAHRIAYERVDHPPVYTCEEAEELVPQLPGAHTKNLFLRDGKGRRHFLVVVDWEKQVDLKQLAQVLQVNKLGMASPQRLQKYLGVEPGAVTLLGVVNDAEKGVEVLFDEEIWAAEALQCHPLVNTATLAIGREDVERFLQASGHGYRVVDVPARKDRKAPPP